MGSILLVDDDTGFTEATSELLRILGHEVVTVGDVAAAQREIGRRDFTILLLDLMLPDGTGLEVLERLPPDRHPHVAIVTGNEAVKTVVSTMVGPNISYLIKPITREKLDALLQRADETASPPLRAGGGNRAGAAGEYAGASGDFHYGSLIGESPVMLELYRMIERVAATEANVLLEGESGTGKELVAHAIHVASKADGPFVAANCGAITRELVASELFGHEKGAFTGAVSRKPGFFEQADHGTLFLDEITEMPLDMQPNLLRVLETQRVTRLGSSRDIPIHCRVISATNRSQDQIARDACLREDLYFRLAVFPIAVPPLRERKEDIPLLVRTFLAEFCSPDQEPMEVDDESMAKLQAYEWPGNVRELRHVIHRAFIMTEGSSRHIALPDPLTSPFARNRQSELQLQPGRTIDEVEKELITLTLKKVDGNKQSAAQMLGISVKTLYNRLNSYDKQPTL